MKFFTKTACILLAVCILCPVLGAPSPWDSWRAGYINCEKGEEQYERGNYTAALALFEKARKSYKAVRSSRPDWNQRVIAERIAECDRKIGELQRLLSAVQRRPGTSSTAAKTPGAKAPSAGTKPEKPEKTPIKNAGKVDLAASSEPDSAAMLELRSTLERLRKELEQSRKDAIALRTKLLEAQSSLASLKKNSAAQRNFEQEIAKLVRDRRIAQEKYDLLEARCKNLEAEIAKPNTQVEALKKRLIEERTAYERELKRSADLEKRLRESDELARENRIARNAAEKVIAQLKQTQIELSSEIQMLKQRLQDSANKNQELAGELERSKKHSEELAKAIKSGKDSSHAASVALTAEMRKNIAERDSKISTL